MNTTAIERLERKEKLEDIQRLRRQLYDILVDLDWLVAEDREYASLFEKLDLHMNRADHYFSLLVKDMKKDIRKLNA